MSSLRSDEPGAPIASAVMERERKKAAAERSKVMMSLLQPCHADCL